jgi:hypothetical protein
VPECARKYAYCAAIGEKLAHVQHRVGRRLDLELHAFEVHAGDRHALTGGEHDLAAFGLDDAAVLNVRRYEHDVPALPRLDPAVVHDRARAAVTLELQLPGEEVRVLHAQSRADEARGIDHRAGADQDAGRIDQEYAPVGTERAVNPRNVGADDAVEHRTRSRLLVEIRLAAGGDREALPVDDRPGRVGDLEVIGPEALHLHVAVHDLRGCGICERRSNAETAADGNGHGPHQPKFPFHWSLPCSRDLSRRSSL